MGNGLVGQRVRRFDESSVGEGVTARTNGVKSRGLRKLAEELASNPELRGVVETFWDNLQKGR